MQRRASINGSKRCVGTRCSVSTLYTQEQLNYLRVNRTMPRALLKTEFNQKFRTNKTLSAIKTLCTRMQWSTGRTGCFRKGAKPWNTDTKGVCVANSGSFQKGHRPKNWKPIGSERICTGDGCILIKVAEPNVWKYKHVVIWTAKHGEVKAGHVIRFKDSNQLNCALDNLEEVSKPVHLYLNRNCYTEMPGELKPSFKAMAEVRVKIFKRQREG